MGSSIVLGETVIGGGLEDGKGSHLMCVRVVRDVVSAVRITHRPDKSVRTLGDATWVFSDPALVVFSFRACLDATTQQPSERHLPSLKIRSITPAPQAHTHATQAQQRRGAFVRFLSRSLSLCVPHSGHKEARTRRRVL